MKVVLQPAAREDILRQYRYYLIEKGVAATAESFLKAVRTTIEQLGRNPGIGAPKILKNPALTGLRSGPVAGFRAVRIYYTSVENTLQVVRVLHGSRDINVILEGLAGPI